MVTEIWLKSVMPFFRLYDCGLWLTIVIKSLKKPSKSVRRYMKSWGLKIISNFFFGKIQLKFEWNAKKFNKKLDPPSPLPWHLQKFWKYQKNRSFSQWLKKTDWNSWPKFRSVTGHRSTTLVRGHLVKNSCLTKLSKLLFFRGRFRDENSLESKK